LVPGNDLNVGIAALATSVVKPGTLELAVGAAYGSFRNSPILLTSGLTLRGIDGVVVIDACLVANGVTGVVLENVVVRAVMSVNPTIEVLGASEITFRNVKVQQPYFDHHPDVSPFRHTSGNATITFEGECTIEGDITNISATDSVGILNLQPTTGHGIYKQTGRLVVGTAGTALAGGSVDELSVVEIHNALEVDFQGILVYYGQMIISGQPTDGPTDGLPRGNLYFHELLCIQDDTTRTGGAALPPVALAAIIDYNVMFGQITAKREDAAGSTLGIVSVYSANPPTTATLDPFYLTAGAIDSGLSIGSTFVPLPGSFPTGDSNATVGQYLDDSTFQAEDLILTATGSDGNNLLLQTTSVGGEILLWNQVDTGLNAIELIADAGGVHVRADIANAAAIHLESTAGGVDVDAADVISLVSSKAAGVGIRLQASAVDGVIDIDAGTGPTGNFFVNGGGAVSLTSTSIDGISAVELTATNGGIRLTTDGNVGKAFTINAGINTAGAGLMDINVGSGGLTANTTGSIALATDTTGTISLTTAGGGEIDLTTSGKIDINATGAGDLDIDVGTGGIAVNTTGAIVLATDTTGSISLAPSGGGEIDFTTSGKIDVNATGTGDLDIDVGTGGITVNTTGSISLVTDTAGNILIDAANGGASVGSLGLVSQGVASGWSHTATAGENLSLTLGGTANTQSLILSSTGNSGTAIALLCPSANGGITLDADNGTTAGAISLQSRGLASSWSHTATLGEDLSIILGGAAGTQSLNITSTGTGTDAINIAATGGGIAIASQGTSSLWTHTAIANGNDLTLSVVAAGTNSSLILTSDGSGADAVSLLASGPSGGVRVDASNTGATTGAITILSQGIASSWTHSYSGPTQDLTIGVQDTGGGNADSSLILTSDGTGADAVRIFASDAAGGIDIDAGSGGIVATATLGTVNLTSSQAAPTAIQLNATGAAGGINLDGGAGGSSGAVTISSDNIASGWAHTVNGDGQDLLIQLADDGTPRNSSVIVQSEGTAADAIRLENTHVAGGLTIIAGTTGIDIESTGKFDVDVNGRASIDSALADPTAIALTASNAGGGIQLNTGGNGLVDINAGSGGIDADATGSINLASALAASTAVVIGATDNAGGVQINAGTGGTGLLALNAGSTGINAAAAGVINLSSSNVGPAITIGASNAAGSIAILSSNGTVSIGAGSGVLALLTTGGASMSGGSINLSSTAGAATLNGNLNATLSAAGGLATVSGPAVAISAGISTLAVTAATGLTLNGGTVASTATTTSALAATTTMTVTGGTGASLIATTLDAAVTAASNVVVTAGVAIQLNAPLITFPTASPTLSAAGNIGVTGGTGASLNATIGTASVNATADDVSLNAGTDVNITAGDDIILDAPTGKFTVTATEATPSAVSIAADGGTAATMVLASTGTGTSAITLNSTGGVDVNAGTQITLDAAAGNVAITATGAASNVSLTAGNDIILDAPTGKFTVTATEATPSAVSIAADGGAAATMVLSSAGTGTSALSITSAGGLRQSTSAGQIYSTMTLPECTAVGTGLVPRWGSTGPSASALTPTIFIQRIELFVDIQGFVQGGTVGDIIGDSGGGSGNLGQMTDANVGTVLWGTMMCIELPTGATNADIDLHMQAVLPAQNAVLDAGSKVELVNIGGEWTTLGKAEGFSTAVIANYYLCLNTTATGGTYSAGRFIISLFCLRTA